MFEIFTQEYKMEELLRLGQDFRSHAPKAGTADMILAIAEMVATYDTISVVNFDENPASKEAQIGALAGMMNIKRMFAKQDWVSIGRNSLLYGLTPFLPD